jgi:hypothetical protein
MKKFLFVLLMALMPIIGVQTKGQQQEIQTYQSTRQMYINWTLVGEPSWTTPSFYYCVTRIYYNGYYYFDVWFTSNAYTWDYYNNQSSWRYVYMDGLKMTYDGYYVNSGYPVSFSFIKDYNPPSTRWVTTNPNPKVKLYWNKYYKL